MKCLLEGKKSLHWWLLALVMAVFFSFGFHHLTKFITSDEHYWFGDGQNRIEKYWLAIRDHKWEKTRVNDKPGITLAYTAGIAQLFDLDADKQVTSDDGFVRTYDPAKTEEINFAYRLPILLISGFSAIYFFWIIRKVTNGNGWLAAYSVAFLFLSPVIIGLSQIVNPDSMFWVFAFASLLSFVAYLQDPKRKFVILTGIFLGLAMASKYVAFILVPFFILSLVAYLFLERDDWKGDRKILAKRVNDGILSHLAIIAMAAAIFAVMMPAVFIDPRYFLENNIGDNGSMTKVFLLVILLDAVILADARINGARIMDWIFRKAEPFKSFVPKAIYAVLSLTIVFILVNWMSRFMLYKDLSGVPFDLKLKNEFGNKPFFEKYVLEAVPLTFALTPLAVFALLFAWIKGIFGRLRHATLAALLSAFMLIFLLASVGQGLMLQIRYSIILFPIASILAGMAFDETLSSGKGRKGGAAWAAFLSVSAILGIAYAYSLSIQSGSLNEKKILRFFEYHGWIALVALAAIAAVSAFVSRRVSLGKTVSGTRAKTLAFAGIVVASAWSAWAISPFYFNYTSDLLPKKYIITAAWGYGGYEGAQYMNSLPNAENSTIWADSYGLCEFYVGKCIHKSKVDIQKYPIDYFYTTLRGQLRPKFPYNKSDDPVWVLRIDGRNDNFLKVYGSEPVTVPEQAEEGESGNGEDIFAPDPDQPDPTIQEADDSDQQQN